MERYDDTGHYIEDEQETYCNSCGHVVKAYVVQNGDQHTVVCTVCKSRGAPSETIKKAWLKWSGAGLAG
jgi:hypothetical protein